MRNISNKWKKMKQCLKCKNTFEKGKIVGGRLGFAWIIFIFVSMGIGILFWLFSRGNRKEVCPFCKSENIIDGNKIILDNKGKEDHNIYDIRNENKEENIHEDPCCKMQEDVIDQLEKIREDLRMLIKKIE